MINTNAEIIKNNNNESLDLKEMLSDARNMVRAQEMEATEAEEEARSLELELMNAQEAQNMREEAEIKGQETKEKIGEAAG